MGSFTPTLAIVAALRPDPRAGGEGFDGLIDQGLGPLLDRLEARPRLRISLSLDGDSLRYCHAQAPLLVQRLQALAKAGRIELLGGGFYDPVLPAIPARDALGQLRLHAQAVHELSGQAPRGLWLPLSAWEPSVVLLAAESGLRYTLVDGLAFEAAGINAAALQGHWISENQGKSLAVFPSVDQLGGRDIEGPADGVSRWLVHPGGSSTTTLCLRAWDQEGYEHCISWVEAASRRIASLRSVTLNDALRGESSSGRIHIPPWFRAGWAPWTLRSAGLLSGSGAQSWQAFRSKYPSVHRLHRRMHWVSDKVDRLRRVVQEVQEQDPGSQTAANGRLLLQRSCASLWRAQSHRPYWYGGAEHEGLYGAGVLQATLSQLSDCESMAERILRERGARAGSCVAADWDLDGEADLLLTTRHLQALLQPGRGGGLWTLDLSGQEIFLGDLVAPVDEPLHHFVDEAALTVVDEPRDRPELLVSGSSDSLDAPEIGSDHGPEETEDNSEKSFPEVAEEDAASRKAEGELDDAHSPEEERPVFWASAPVGEGTSRSYGAFVDRFLAPETKAESFGLRQFRELGDFALGRYELLRSGAGKKREEGDPPGQAWARLGRSGIVDAHPRPSLVRIERTVALDPEHPRLSINTLLVNRSKESASFQYAIEWSFAIPSFQGDGPELIGKGGEDEAVRFLREGPHDLGAQLGLEWKDGTAGLRIFGEFSQPLEVWWCPIWTQHQTPEGCKRLLRGNTLVFAAPTALWGEDSLEMSLRFSFLSGDSR